MTNPKFTTFKECIEHFREEEERQSREAVILIKQIHASPPLPIDTHSELKWTFCWTMEYLFPHQGAVAKFSPYYGDFNGWYRDDQRSGQPNGRLPIQVKLDEAFEQWARDCRRAVPVAIAARLRGIQSGKIRSERSLAKRIIQKYFGLQEQCTPKPHRAKLIARDLDCNLDYVRRVLREHRNKLTRKKT